MHHLPGLEERKESDPSSRLAVIHLLPHALYIRDASVLSCALGSPGGGQKKPGQRPGSKENSLPNPQGAASRLPSPCSPGVGSKSAHGKE